MRSHAVPGFLGQRSGEEDREVVELDHRPTEDEARKLLEPAGAEAVVKRGGHPDWFDWTIQDIEVVEW